MRAALAPVGLLLTVLLMSACGASTVGGPSPDGNRAAGRGQLRTFSLSWLSFRYPASWRAYPQPDDVGSFASVLTVLSDRPVSNLCKRGPQSVNCEPPRDQLRPGGVVVLWVESDTPDQAHSPVWEGVPGTPTTVAGLDARVQTSLAQDWCNAIGGTRELEANVLRNKGMVTVWACMADPHAMQTQARVQAMLTTATF